MRRIIGGPVLASLFHCSRQESQEKALATSSKALNRGSLLPNYHICQTPCEGTRRCLWRSSKTETTSPTSHTILQIKVNVGYLPQNCKWKCCFWIMMLQFHEPEKDFAHFWSENNSLWSAADRGSKYWETKTRVGKFSHSNSHISHEIIFLVNVPWLIIWMEFNTIYYPAVI